MTLAQRKIELINWITELNSEESLSQIEELKNSTSSALPKELLEYLEAVDRTGTEGMRKHTSVKDIRR